MLAGVVHSVIGPPKKLTDEKLEKHQSAFVREHNMLVVKYQGGKKKKKKKRLLS